MMNSKIKLGIFALLIGGAVLVVSSELFSHGWGRGYGHRGPGYGSGHMMGPGYMHGPGYGGYENFKSELGLTEEQIEKIHKINTKYREKFFRNRNNSEKHYSLRNEQRKEIESVLTKKQKEKFSDTRGYGRRGWYRGCGW
jgi:Spy/CpxP family protein refolding chaperone